MAQMAPAITEASASPGSSRKNSVDLFCSSEKLEEDGTSLGVDLALFSQNGLVRLLGEASSTSDIAKTSKNTPIVLKRREELKGKVEMPNGHCNDITGKHCSDPVKVSESEEEKRKQSAVDLSRKTCASTTAARGSTGTDCEEESRNRVSQHPVANLESPKAFLSKRSARAIHRQGRLENQARKLGKRLRRLQARQIDLHVRQQLSGFFGHQRETSQSLTESGNKDASKGGIDVVSDRSAELETERSVNPEPNGCTTTTSVVNQGTVHTASFQSDGRGNGLIRKNESHDFEKKDFSSLSNDEIQMAGSVLGRMSSQVEHLENIGDSDATDVSSGEESESEDGKRFKLKSKRWVLFIPDSYDNFQGKFQAETQYSNTPAWICFQKTCAMFSSEVVVQENDNVWRKGTWNPDSVCSPKSDEYSYLRNRSQMLFQISLVLDKQLFRTTEATFSYFWISSSVVFLTFVVTTEGSNYLFSDISISGFASCVDL